MIIAVALTLQGQDLMATDAYRRTFEEVLQNLPVLLDDLERGLTEFQ